MLENEEENHKQFKQLAKKGVYMRLRDRIKKYLPSYRTEERMNQKLDSIKKDIRELDNKHEYLFWLSQLQPGETMQQTKERVFLSMPKATGRLRNIQLAENHILQRVKDICDQNGLQFFLIGGTLIGALRHKGFIPWDNDIDIGMMRQDFRKLKDILEQDKELTLEYCYNYSAGLKIPKIKFRASKTIFIDVFIFDYIDIGQETAADIWPVTQKLNREYSDKLRELAQPYAEGHFCRPMENSELDKVIAEVETSMERCFGRFGHGNWFCETLDSPYWSRDPRGMLSADVYFPLQKNAVEFEGKCYDVWNNYDLALTHMFGDIWKLPFSVMEPHTTEFDEGLEDAFVYLRQRGILD